MTKAGWIVTGIALGIIAIRMAWPLVLRARFRRRTTLYVPETWDGSEREGRDGGRAA